MIKVEIRKDQILVVGHADYAEFGKDIVCASVTSIVTTSVNAIMRLDRDAINYKSESGLIEINVKNHSDLVDTLLLNMTELLRDLEKKYSRNIKINEEVL